MVCVPKSTDFGFLGPGAGVKAVGEVFAENRAVLVVYHGRDTVVDQEPGKGKTGEKTNQGDNGDPFLLGILLGLPWLIHFALADSS